MPHLSQSILWRYANGGLPPRRRARVRGHARECARCRVELERAILARRALAGDADASRPTDTELGTWGAELLGRLESRPVRSRAAYVGLGALAAVAAVTAGLWLAPPPTDESLVARGTPSPAPLHLRVVCVAPEASRTFITDPDSGPCALGTFLKVMVGTNTSARQRLAVVAIRSQGLEHLYPDRAGAPLVLLPAKRAPLTGSFRLDARWVGRVRIVALAVEDKRLAGEDPLWAWAQDAAPGRYWNVLDRADAVVTEITVGGPR